MNQRLSISELESRLRDPDVPEKQLRKYFKVEPNPAKPFSPTVSVDHELVDVDMDPVTEAAMVQDWIIQAALERRQEQYRRKIAAGWPGLRFVAEGDSWFQYPSFLLADGADIIDNLFDQYAIFCSSFAGDTFREILEDLDELESSIASENASALLFSAGGNDLVGRDQKDERGVGLGRFVLGYSPAHPDRPAAEYINTYYSTFLEGISDDYRHMVERLLASFPDLKIFYHGYDRAYPRWQGTWLYPALHEKQIPVALWPGVVAELINRFSDALIALAAEFPDHVYHVECRGAIGAKHEWRDELHGKGPGCERAAKRFEAAIGRAFPSIS